MKTITSWIDEIPPRNGTKCVVHSICFRPDGSEIVAAVDARVIIYNAENGELLHSLKAHKDVVYSVDYARNGKRFASGGADNTVIIWTHNAEGILKYTHVDTIQKIIYNPVTLSLASCTGSDFGIWSPQQKSVTKHKVASKILSASWSNNGQHLAIGMLNGQISIRDRKGNESTLIERKEPIWTVCWNPSLKEPIELLAVGCWDQTLSFYQLNGSQYGKDKKLDFNPCCVSYYSNGQYLLVGGSNKKAALYTKEGTKLEDIATMPSWVWTVKGNPKSNFVAVGSDDGTITMEKIVFATVHGIYQERYAYRENMTDVIIQHLMTEQRVRIKTRDIVKKLAVFRNRLAIQLSDRIIIYELTNESSYDMHYKVRERIYQKLDCSLLVVTSSHLVLCLENKIQQYDFTGKKEREWVLEAFIRYIKVTGGVQGKEGLLVGLKNGAVLQIFVNNPFAIPLIQQNSPIRCLDICADRTKLAVVDDESKCSVYDMKSKELLYQEEDANSVAWNADCNDMLCYSGSGKLKIKTGNFPAHSQLLQGFVVGFSGSKVFSLSSLKVQTVDVPQSAPLYRFIEEKQYSEAYNIACLGVTETDWRLLALESLKAMKFDIARKAFIRLRDMRFIELLNSVEKRKQQNSNMDDSLIIAEVFAYEGKYTEAAKVFAKAGKTEMGLALFTDLRLWDQAKDYAAENGTVNASELMQQQASWAEEVHDWRAASEMHIACGNYLKAVRIMGDRKWYDELANLAKKLDAQSQSKALNLCATYLFKAKQFRLCRDVYLKIGNIQALVKLHVQLEEWEEAIRLCKQHQGEYATTVYLPYAEWLCTRDLFDDALEAFRDAGRPDHSIKLLEQLTHNAVIEHRFNDASYYHYVLSDENIKLLEIDREAIGFTLTESSILYKMRQHARRSDLYYAYHFVHAYTTDPFTSYLPETLFNAARFIINVVGTEEAPYGISKAHTLFTLGQQAIALEAFKLARFAFEKLQKLVVSPAWMDQIDLAVMTLQTKPFADREDLLPIDYRTSSTNPLVNTTGSGDCCVNSGHPFIRSFATFEILPLVEFQPHSSLTDEDAVKLIQCMNDDEDTPGGKKSSDGWHEKDHGNDIQTMQFGDDDAEIDEDTILGEKAPEGTTLFDTQLGRQVCSSSDGKGYKPLLLDSNVLKSLREEEVFILEYPGSLIRNKYYKNMIPEIKLRNCPSCRKFFHEDDFDFEYLKKLRCPFCHTGESMKDKKP